MIEETKDYWRQEAQERLLREVNYADSNRQAKNVIIFLGDGMGVSTLTAGGDWRLFSWLFFPFIVNFVSPDSEGSAGGPGGRRTVHSLLRGVSAPGSLPDLLCGQHGGGLRLLGDGLPRGGEGDLQDHRAERGRAVQEVRDSAGD